MTNPGMTNPGMTNPGATDPGRRCAVLGSPIAHSLSPALHRAAYAELGLDWRYDAYEVDEESLAGFVEGLGPQWRGLSLTMPLKRAAISLCDEVSDLARTVSAVNTVVIDEAGRRSGSNTDVPGMVQAFASRGLTSSSAAVVLGVGATACSTVAALAELDVRTVQVFARDPSRGAELMAVARHVGLAVEVRPWAELAEVDRVDVAVSTVPADAVASMAETVADRARVIFEVLYHPWPTPLVAAAQSAGRVVIGGLDLLVHQAALQVEVMTGASAAPVAAMRRAGERVLAARSPAP